MYIFTKNTNTSNENNQSIYLKKSEFVDNYFLIQVFIECRPHLQWICKTNEQQMVIIQQYENEHKQIARVYPNAEYNIIMLNNIRVGRLIINKKEKTVRTIEIGLIESYRNIGIGSALIQRIKELH